MTIEMPGIAHAEASYDGWQAPKAFGDVHRDL
jgi:hypothetical protein